MKVVILYDDVLSAARANGTLERVSYRAKDAPQWNVKPWRLDLLNRSPAAAAALTEAADAHLIVFAVRQALSLPAWLLDWLEQWATRRQVWDAALAMWDGGHGELLSAPANPALSQFAERHGLSFIFADVGPAEDKSSFSARSLHERAVTQTRTLQRIMAEPVRNYYQHWGINE